MTKKIRGSEKMLFTCDKNGKRSLADFENVEEALQASGGMDFPNIGLQNEIPFWWRFGDPGPLTQVLSQHKIPSQPKTLTKLPR